MSFTSNSRLKGWKSDFSTPSPCLRSKKNRSFFFKLQPKRVLQWGQTITKPHPSNSCQSYMRTEIPRKSRHKTSEIHGMMQKNPRRNFPKESSSPLDSSPTSKPRRLYSTGCSVWSAHGAQGKVTVGYPQVSVKRLQPVLRYRRISKHPPFCPNVPFILVVARFEMQHDAVVNHVCMSKQLCQAESECPLLARLRPMSLSKGASWVKCHSGKILRKAAKRYKRALHF